MHKKIVIPEKYRTNLDSRFNPKNAAFRKPDHVVEFEHIAINIPCALCIDNRSRCEFCPLYVFNYDYIACRDFVSSLLKSEKLPFMMYIERVFWFPEDHDEAVAALNELRLKAGQWIIWV